MIRLLRRRLIGVSMLSLFAVLAIIVTAVNVINYQRVAQEADGILAVLAEGDGRFPAKPMGDRGPNKPPQLSPEMPYESRFFTVLLHSDGTVLSSELSHIAAVDEQTATQMATAVVGDTHNSGYHGNYRYTVVDRADGTLVIFLDCTRSLSHFRDFLWISCLIAIIGLATVFLLIWLLSGRIVKPLLQAHEKQRQFITDAGHEIKTPITIIDADVELLEMELGENEWLQDIRQQVKRLGDLTGDLIFLSRMDEEQKKLQAIDFPLSDTVSETAGSFQAPAKREDKTLTLAVEPMLTLCGDEKSIRQLVSILMDNAVKYTDEGGEIHLALRRQGKTAILTVSNTCRGMDEADISKLFDRFYRTDRSRNSATGGYGIGLSIAKAVVNAHKGKIIAAKDGDRLVLTATLPLTQ